MVEQFVMTIQADLLDRLPDVFPQASGRDIEGLARLVAKYFGQKQVAPTKEVFGAT